MKDKQQIADVKAICTESNNTILLDMQYRTHPCLTERFTTYGYRRYNEDVTFHLIELPKYIKQKKKTNKINIWLEFLLNPLGKGVEEAMRTEEELRKAVDLLKLLNSDDEVRAIAEAEEFAEIDRRSEINFARRESFEMGEKRVTEKIAVNLLKQGMSVEDIIKATNIDKEILKKLIVKNNICNV